MSSSRLGGRGGRAATLLLVLVAAFTALWLAVGSAGSATVPYSAGSVAPDGAKGLAILLAQLGDRVDTTPGPLPAPGRAVAVLLYDQLDDAARSQVSSWVRRGGTLVVADPSSRLMGAALAYGAPDQVEYSSSVLYPGCDVPWVKAVGAIDPEGDPLLEVPGGAPACFGQGGDAFAVETRLGAGVIVSLGGADLWDNAALATNDNAMLAADLLAPGPGYEVVWLSTPWVAGGNASLWGLVPLHVKFFLAGLGVALLVTCLWQSRRLGKPVPEEPVVPLPGSELVVATSRMLARNRRFAEAAAVMRADLAGQLRARYGQGAQVEPTSLASVVAARTGLNGEEVMTAIAGPPPANEPELLAVARHLERVQQEALGGPGS
ncbi:MAG TPA: DUF4350 domain-containing protein [Acidimicrobiales bacterium]|nr:DUF4350 domain-containing protein [Acidimicrobiales bacterium]